MAYKLCSPEIVVGIALGGGWQGEKEKRKEAGNRMMRGGDCRTSGPCVLRAMGSVVITYNLSDFIPQMFISHPTNIGADQKVFSSIWQIQDPAIIA